MICSPVAAARGEVLASLQCSPPRAAFDFTPVGDYAVSFALTYGWVNADVLHAIPYAGDKRKIGKLLVALEEVGFLRKSYAEKSRRRKCHHRPIMRYELVRCE